MSYGKGDFGDASFPAQSTPAAGGGGATSTNMDYSRLTSVVASNTTKIGQNNKEINRLAGYIGTEQDGASIREQLQQKQQVTRKLCKDTERFLKELKDLPPPEQDSEKRQRRVMLTKLANTFSNCLNEFQRAQRESLDKERAAMKSQQTQEGQTLINMENTAGQVQVQQTMNQDEYQAMQERENAIAQLEVQETRLQREMREEEDRELAKLENDITTMAEVFVETQKLVTEQGEVVDSIENNIENAVTDISAGNQQLIAAREHQRSARKKKIIIAIIALIFVLVLFLIIYFSIPSSNSD